ncbi:MAG: hypothetical protein ACT4OE_03945 [Sphingosinicella sp.]
MARTNEVQLNVRSRLARERATAIARETGMTTTRVVEEALLAFRPQAASDVPAGMIRKNGILVVKARGKRVTLKQAEAALRASRLERG